METYRIAAIGGDGIGPEVVKKQTEPFLFRSHLSPGAANTI